MAKLPVYWAPWPGKQALAATCPADEILYGGTRGGGKSDTAIGRQVRGATKHGPNWHGLMARKKYKDLGDIKRKFDALILKGMPAERIGGENQTNIVRFLGGPSRGAEIVLTAFQHVSQLDDWQGFEFQEVTIDEAPQISYIGTVIDKMRGTLRSKQGIHSTLFLTGNPGGPGASTLKTLFNLLDMQSWGKIQNVEVKFDLGGEEIIENVTRVYLHSLLEDNQALDAREYKKKLAMINDTALLEAWLRGDWTVTVGQAFHLDPRRHVIKPIWPIPEHAPLYMTFDWGFGAPFSVGWWWVDNDNRIYRFGEWYGWDGKNPNRGLRLTDGKLADGILEHEKRLGILGRKITRIAGPDCFRRKPNYLGGGQGDSTADEFKAFASSSAARDKFGNNIELNLIPGDADRERKLRQFRNRMSIPDVADLPPMVVYDTCTQFIRTIPSIALDEENIEVIEEGQEDHVYDEACHICMARPIGANIESLLQSSAVVARSREAARLDPASRAAAQEMYIIKRQLVDNDPSVDEKILRDPSLDPATVGLRDLDFEDMEMHASEMIQLFPQLRDPFK